MPDGERVTTGSEPPFTLRRCRECGAGEIDRPEWQVPLRHHAGCQRKAANVEVVRVVEVEPGHDEQTEERVAWSKALQHAQAEVEAERERTVAAVVEALRDVAHDTKLARQGHAFADAADLIEERFKLSAPGGGNA